MHTFKNVCGEDLLFPEISLQIVSIIGDADKVRGAFIAWTPVNCFLVKDFLDDLCPFPVSEIKERLLQTIFNLPYL